MIRILVSVKDLKAQEYLFVLHFKNAAEAQRHYVSLLETPNLPLAKHPRDYALHQIATIDSETGAVAPTPVTDHTPYNYLDTLDLDRTTKTPAK